MEKYKLCPTCEVKNSPTSLECKACETDLTSISILDNNSEKLSQEDPVNTKFEFSTFRICECGAKNLSAIRKCHVCNEDISDIAPITCISNENLKFILCTIDQEYKSEINDTIVIGREQGMQEYLEKKIFVSRTHAKIIRDNNELFVENLSQTNFTYINNIKLDYKEKAKIVDGDELALGGLVHNGERQDNAAYFLVRIELCI